jgi:hypothetical protein
VYREAAGASGKRKDNVMSAWGTAHKPESLGGDTFPHQMSPS